MKRGIKFNFGFDLLVAALQHSEIASADEELVESRRNALGEELKQKFIKTVSDRETHAHQEIIKLFRHHRVKTESAGESLFDAELFSDDTWRAFGLNAKQLIVAGAIGGAAAGATVDVMTLGQTLLAGAAIGGMLGAAGGMFVGKKRPELKVSLPLSSKLKMIGLGKKLDLGGRAISVGPYAALNFPWILFDRAFGTFFYVINRAHARQDGGTIQSSQVNETMKAAGISTAQWDDANRKECEKVFNLIRKKKLDPEHRTTLRKLIRDRLTEVAAANVDAAPLQEIDPTSTAYETETPTPPKQ